MPRGALNLIDMHVGSRVRMRRLMLDMSQSKLADALRLTFQQVQKYQKGANRIGAGRLQHISQILQVTVPFFFEGAPAASGARPSAREAAEDDLFPSYLADSLATPDGLSLVKAFMSIEDTKLRRAIVRLVEEIVPETLCFRTNASRPSVRAGGIDEMIGDLN
jgi:transcriptional regulator with XRE-family HTH domain